MKRIIGFIQNVLLGIGTVLRRLNKSFEGGRVMFGLKMMVLLVFLVCLGLLVWLCVLLFSMLIHEWLIFLVWLGVPLFALLIGVLLVRRSKTLLGKRAAVLASITIFISPHLVVIGMNYYYDEQVRKLCAIDGGIRVYETVSLPAAGFNQWGNPDIPSKRYAKSTDEYYYETEVHYYRRGNPDLLRIRNWIVRRSDGKVLGDSITYVHSGPDLPMLPINPSFMCPAVDSKGKPNIEQSIFLKESEK